eukprot:5986500-Ditylum_brightwellii.AAC.1
MLPNVPGTSSATTTRGNGGDVQRDDGATKGKNCLTQENKKGLLYEIVLKKQKRDRSQGSIQEI